MTAAIKLSAAGLGAALALSACSTAPMTPATAPSTAGPTTEAAPTAPPRPAPATATSTTAPASAPLPEAATHRTEAGALAFVRHYLQVFNRVAVDPAEGQFEALSEASCKTCRAMAVGQAYLVRYQQRYRSRPTRIDRVGATPGADPLLNPYRVLADVTTLGVPIIDRQGDVLRSDKKSVGTFSFFLTWTGRSWTVTEIKKVA